MSCTCESYYSYVCPACRPRPKADLAAMCESLRVQLAAALEVVAAADDLSLYELDVTDRVKIALFRETREKLRRLQGD